MFEITEKTRLCENVVRTSIRAPLIAKSARAGQFIILRVDEYGERVPFTVSGRDEKRGTIDIIYQEVGKSTLKLSLKGKGDEILDVSGPLGRASDLDGYENAVVVGGGLGCAISYPQAARLRENNCRVKIIAGFRNSGLIILEKEMRSICDDLEILTDDGSNGNKGLVTDALYRELRENKSCELVVVAGPLPMMKAVCEVTEKFDVKTLASMNPIMIDGTGMCGGCRLSVGGETKFACVDGPDFDGRKVDFDELISRNGVYRDIEAREREKCRLLFGS